MLRSPPSSLPYEREFHKYFPTAIEEDWLTYSLPAGALFEGGTCYNDPSSGRVFPSDAAKADGCSGGSGGGTATANPTEGNSAGIPDTTAPGEGTAQTGIATAQTGIDTVETAATVDTASNTAQIVPTVPAVPTAVSQPSEIVKTVTVTYIPGGSIRGRHHHDPLKRGKRHSGAHILDAVQGFS